MTDREIIENTLRATGREGIESVLQEMDRLKFYHIPGSIKYHSAYKGGLAEHSLKVYRYAMQLKQDNAKAYGFLPDDSIAIAALLHDFCKADSYFIRKDGKPGRSLRKFPIGHGEKSVIMLLLLGLKLTEDEMLAIRWHMGEYTVKETGLEKDNYLSALKSPSNSLIDLIQQADYIAAKE